MLYLCEIVLKALNMKDKNLIVLTLVLLLCASCDKGEQMTLSGLNVRDFHT